MAAIKARRSRNSSLMFLGVFGGILVLGIVGAGVYVAAGGSITIPFTNPPRVLSMAKQIPETPWSPPIGKIPVPQTARAIPAYAKVKRDDFYNATERRYQMVYLEPGQVGPKMITNLEDILGRVLDHDKPAGFVFTEDDFLPKGTRPGLVAGIPPGMRAMRVELSKVRGLYGLMPGDRFDLVSTLAVTTDAAQDLRKIAGANADRFVAEAALSTPAKQASVTVVVQNGIVVSPVQTVEVPVSMSSLASGSRVSSKPLQEVVIAVHPAEVAALSEAMAVEAQLAVVPRSGRPDDPADSVTPDRRPKSPFSGAGGDSASIKFVETIDGDKHEIVPVRATDAGKAGAPSEK
jgi:Flp pilus assembly protein CpaB